MQWHKIYENDCEQGFYDQHGASELTVPIGTTVHWLQGTQEGLYPRPEMDKKEVPQQEVYPDGGRLSCGGFYMSAVGRFGLVTDRIYVEPGTMLRASAKYMHVFNGVHVGGGSRVGIVQGDGPFDTAETSWPVQGTDPFADPAIIWGEWKGTYQGDTPNREWVTLTTSESQTGLPFVRLVVQFNVDVAGEGSHGHWDLVTLHALMDEAPPTEPPTKPPTGDCEAAVEVAALSAKLAQTLRTVGEAVKDLGQTMIEVADNLE